MNGVPICYNLDFSNTDAARLCQNAPIANHPLHRPYTCCWMTSQGICNSYLQCAEFSDHLRSHHGVVGPDQTRVVCRWANCFTELKKESLMRHINEKHLELRYPCPNCDEEFTRPYTMQSHIQRKHSGT